VRTALRIAVILAGAGFVLQGIGWVVAPARAAEGLGMPLLDGLGRSTQVGDFAAFFLTAGATMLIGTRPGRARLLLVPAGLLAAAAVVRTLAWAVHGAALAVAFVTVEVAVAALLLVAVRTFDARSPRPWPDERDA
jgi:hypothetical protein